MSKKFEKGDAVFLIKDSPKTTEKFSSYGVEYGDRGKITGVFSASSMFDYDVKFESHDNGLRVAEEEIDPVCENGHDLVYHDKRKFFFCPRCDEW